NITDMDYAVKRCVFGGFAYSGQVCIHAQRFFVEDNVFDKFTEKFIKETEKLKMGDPLNPETDISAMIDEPNAIRVDEWVNEAVNSGARVLCGGKRKGEYYEPTILTGTKNDMKVCSFEIFGPVVSVEPYSDFEKAVKEVNNSRYGLQAGVFTDKVSEMNYAFKKLQVGGVILNDVPTFRVDHMPYGGIKDSGLGREGLKYAIAEMMEPKILVKNK
ncbi:aldehyde dehydrogenase family protein, partial [candidate division KSB1 bacterium]